MIIYEREYNENKNLEAIIPEELTNVPQMDTLVQELLSAKQVGKAEVKKAEKEIAKASIKNAFVDIMVSETDKLITLITILNKITGFMSTELTAVPEITVTSSSSKLIKHSSINWKINNDLFAEIAIISTRDVSREYDAKITFFRKSRISSYGMFLIDSRSKSVSYVYDNIYCYNPGPVEHPDPEIVEFINNFVKKLCDNVGLNCIGKMPTDGFRSPLQFTVEDFVEAKTTYNNDLTNRHRLFNLPHLNTLPDIKDLPVPDHESSMYGICGNESEDDDEGYDDYDDDYEDEDE